MKTFTTPSGTVRVNDTQADAILVEDIELRHSVDTAMAALRRISLSQPSGRKALSGPGEDVAFARVLVRAHEAGHVLLSPSRFVTSPVRQLPSSTALLMLEESKLGVSLSKDLASAGLFDFLDRISNSDNQMTYRSLLVRVLASLAMAVGGVTTTADIPRDAFLTWLHFFKTDLDTRWDQELWRGNPHVAIKCLREVVFAYARLTGQTSRQQRRPSGLTAPRSGIGPPLPKTHRHILRPGQSYFSLGAKHNPPSRKPTARCLCISPGGLTIIFRKV
jgi:hypothetical protein